jgi:HAE1 family hydrophobic/amphiphilic exporter-1
VIETTERAYMALAAMELPRGYAWSQNDSALRRQQEEFGELFKALILSVVLIFLLMGVLFESVLLPFSVLFTLPYALAGSAWTLYLTGRPFDSMGYIGGIILAGVVVNNGIVLIDRIHTMRAVEPDRKRAVVLGCSQRVRPVLMTALTTVVGLLPMIVAEPPPNGVDYRTLATILAGGLMVSTVFTLWVVPLAYTLIDDAAHFALARVRWWLRPPRLPARMQRKATA